MENAYREQLEQRFPDRTVAGEEIDASPLIQQILARKTVRRYADRVRSEALLDLVVAAALSAAAKSDFQQASILRIADREQRGAIGALFPAMPWIAEAPAFWVFLGAMHGVSSASEICEAKRSSMGASKGFSTLPPMPLL